VATNATAPKEIPSIHPQGEANEETCKPHTADDMRKRSMPTLLTTTQAALPHALADLLRVSNVKFWWLPMPGWRAMAVRPVW